jgi:hypothetical protein
MVEPTTASCPACREDSKGMPILSTVEPWCSVLGGLVRGGDDLGGHVPPILEGGIGYIPVSISLAIER